MKIRPNLNLCPELYVNNNGKLVEVNILFGT